VWKLSVNRRATLSIPCWNQPPCHIDTKHYNYDQKLIVQNQEVPVKSQELLVKTKNFLVYTRKKGLNFLVQPGRMRIVETRYLTSNQEF
jgi:hypothetical protein